MKKFIGMVTGAFCMAMLALMMVSPLKAEAAGRNVKITYDTGTSAWYININNTYWTSIGGGQVTTLEDGDVVIVDAAGATPASSVKIVTDKKLATLVVTGNVTFIMDMPTPADLVYAANGATIIINGSVKKVMANAGCTTQISGNVEEVEAVFEGDKFPIFAVSGTVGVLKGKMTDGKIYTDIAYSFPAGTVHAYAADKGVVRVSEGTLNGQPVTSNNPGGKKELDEVPKTGSGYGLHTSIIFFGLAAVLAIAAVTVKRRENAK